MDTKLEWTGERMMDDAFLAKGIVEHLHRYAFASELAKGKVVLDIACGEGYGSSLLAREAKQVFGVDISSVAVEHANIKYQKPNLSYLCGSILAIPFEDKSMDLVVSFETLEHLVEHKEIMLEIRRVLKADGKLIISTPEKVNYQKIDSLNPFHLKELDLGEFENLINLNFKNHKMFFQSFSFSSLLYDEADAIGSLSKYNGNFNRIDESPFSKSQYFNLAVCWDEGFLEKIPSSIFDGTEQFENYEAFYSENNNYETFLKEIKKVKDSASYRLGNFLLKPFSWLKSKVSK